MASSPPRARPRADGRFWAALGAPMLRQIKRSRFRPCQAWRAEARSLTPIKAGWHACSHSRWPCDPTHGQRSTRMQLAGRTAIVTGAAQGIGAAVAEALAREGARLCVADLANDRVETLAAALRGGGAEAIGIGCDVS